MHSRSLTEAPSQEENSRSISSVRPFASTSGMSAVSLRMQRWNSALALSQCFAVRGVMEIRECWLFLASCIEAILEALSVRANVLVYYGIDILLGMVMRCVRLILRRGKIVEAFWGCILIAFAASASIRRKVHRTDLRRYLFMRRFRHRSVDPPLSRCCCVGAEQAVREKGRSHINISIERGYGEDFLQRFSVPSPFFLCVPVPHAR